MYRNLKDRAVGDFAGYEARGKVCGHPMNSLKRLAGEFFFFGVAALVYVAFLAQSGFSNGFLGL